MAFNLKTPVVLQLASHIEKQNAYRKVVRVGGQWKDRAGAQRPSSKFEEVGSISSEKDDDYTCNLTITKDCHINRGSRVSIRGSGHCEGPSSRWLVEGLSGKSSKQRESLKKKREFACVGDGSALTVMG